MPVILCTEAPRDLYLPISGATGWHDYYARISGNQHFASAITPDIQPATEDPMASMLVSLMRLASATSAMPLTILAALETLCPDISTKTSIKLHFIGAASREFVALMVFEELLHLLPALKDLELTFVGFDIPRRPKEESSPGRVKLECCPTCTSRGRTRSMALWRGACHDYLKQDSYDTTDLAVAFHTGFSQEMKNEWLPTVLNLATAPHPTLFTSYNETEMEEETTSLRNLGASFKLPDEVNRWKSLCPMLEVMEEQESKVYFLHGYQYITAESGNETRSISDDGEQNEPELRHETCPKSSFGDILPRKRPLLV